MEIGFSPSRKCRVSDALNFGSAANTQRKKRSCEARSNCGMLNTGWCGRGKSFNTSIPTVAEIPAKRTVNSNVIITNEGQEFSGRPPTLIGYVIAETQYCKPYPVHAPRMPQISTTSGTRFLVNPIASPSPCTGKGL